MSSTAPGWDQEIRRRLQSAGLDPARESEIVRELSQHLDDRLAELRSLGIDESEARRRTLGELDEHEMMTRELSRVERLESSSAVLGDTRRQPWFAGFAQDLRYGLRSLRATPGFTIVATITLALAIGATTAIFSIVDAMLLRPLSADPQNRVVRIHWIAANSAPADSRIRRRTPAITSVRQWQQRSDVFDLIGAWNGADLTLLDVDPVERAQAIEVTPDLVRVFDARPASVGRLLVETDSDKPVAVVSFEAWQRRFGGDPGIVGRSIRAVEGSRIIVGVLPVRFPFQPGTDFWLPMKTTELKGELVPASVLARLRPGVTVKQAHDAMASERRQQRDRNGTSITEAIEIISMHEQAVLYTRQMLYFLFGGVCCVLVIGCGNVAGLLIARGAGRQREVAIRASLGAGRGRLIRQFLTESLLLSMIGGFAGIILASLLLTTLISVLPLDVPRDMRPEVSLRLLGVCTLVTLSTSCVFGLWPAIALSRNELSSSTRQAPSSVGGSGQTGRVLVVAQIALAMMLLVSAGLMVRSLQKLMSVDSGFDVDQVLVVEASPVFAADDDSVPSRADTFYQHLVERLSSLPGVTAVSAISHLPYTSYRGARATIEGTPTSLQISPREIMPGYFATMGIPLRAGRDLSHADRRGGPCVAIVNEWFVEQANLGVAPLGRRLTSPQRREESCEIVGVVANVRHVSLEDRIFAEVYYPARQSREHRLAVVVRTMQPAALAPRVRAELADLPERTLVQRVATFDQVLGRTTTTRRNRAVLFSILAGLGILLASVGIFGLTAYAVSRRTREIGVRVALGATPALVLRGVMRDFVPAILGGIALGLFGAWAAARTIEQFLFGVTKYDPVTLTAVSGLLLALGLIASYLPARRALQVDPVTALRSE